MIHFSSHYRSSFLEKFLIRDIRARKSISSIVVEVTDFENDQ